MVEDDRPDIGTREEMVKHTNSTPGSRRESNVLSGGSERGERSEAQVDAPGLYRTKSGPGLSHASRSLLDEKTHTRISQDSDRISSSSRTLPSAQENELNQQDKELQNALRELTHMKRERDELVDTNRNLLDELSDHRRDTYTKYKTPDTEIERQ